MKFGAVYKVALTGTISLTLAAQADMVSNVPSDPTARLQIIGEMVDQSQVKIDSANAEQMKIMQVAGPDEYNKIDSNSGT